ncbi:unnamed protein product [Larinioides sclopetarius]|uniref:Cytochrome P450 n=1 Tax=Larinioides sclopetarius TaxID=280406 RepID=A0AAV2AUI3_9ARAC
MTIIGRKEEFLICHVPAIMPCGAILEKGMAGVVRDMGKNNLGRVYGAFEGSKPHVVISDPELLRDIFIKDFHIFPERRSATIGDPLSDCAVSNLTGEQWKRVRTIITPAFTSKRMRQMGSIINDSTMSLLEVCEKRNKEGKPVDCKGLFGAFTMDVIANAAFGTQIDSHNDPRNPFVQHVKKMVDGFSLITMILALNAPDWFWRFVPFNLNPIRIDKDHFFRDVTLSVIQQRKETGRRYNDLLQILMDAAYEANQAELTELAEDETDRFGSIISDGTASSTQKFKSLSENELLAQCVLLFFVGYETTSSNLTFCAYCLATNPEWQEKLIKEVDEIFEKHSEMNYDTVRDMKILDAVISETLRMHPPLATFLEAPKHPQYAYIPFGNGWCGKRYGEKQTWESIWMGSIINDSTKSLLEVCEKHNKERKPVDCKGLFGAFTMDVIANAAFGTQIDSHNDPQNPFVQHVKKMVDGFSLITMILALNAPDWFWKFVPTNLNPVRIDKEHFFRNITMSVIQQRKESGRRYNDLLQIMIDAAYEANQAELTELAEDETDRFGSIISDGTASSTQKYKSLSEIELLAQCVLLFFVGYETTSSNLTFCAYSLATNPEWQEKLIKEVDEAFEKHSEMSYDAVRDMKILDAVISETLRMHPPLAMFLEAPKHPQYAYIPFGMGPRNCLGMRFALLEIKICLSTILRHFRIKPHSSTKVPLEYKKSFPLLTVNDLPLVFEKRTDVK